MRLPTRFIRSAVPVVALLALSVSGVSAQTADPDRAARMQQNAAELEQRMHEKGPNRTARLEAARYHMEAASARSSSDPQALTNLVTAARHIGELDPERSATIFDRAAEFALAIGDVETAAHAYIDAAIVLKNHKPVLTRTEGAQISAWHHKADLLSNSPLLNTSQRKRILDRIFPTTANAF